MPWTVNAARSVERKLARLSPKDQRLIREALVRLAEDPQRCNLERLESQPTGYRLRVGNWRLMVDVFPEQLLVSIRDLLRRTTTTYRRR